MTGREAVARFQPCAPELVAESGEQQRRGFAGHARDIEHDAGDDAARWRPESPPSGSSATCGAQSHAASRKRLRNRVQELLRAAHGDGNHHDAQRKPPANAEKCCMRSTITVYAKMPMTIEGTPLSRSVT